MSNANRLDPEKVRSAIRLLERERLLMLAERAVSELTPEQGLDVLQHFIRLDHLLAAPHWKAPSLLEQVLSFEAAAYGGQYYDDSPWQTGSRGVSSAGAERFAAELDRLERACVNAVGHLADGEVRQSFERLFGLLRQIGGGRGGILFRGDAKEALRGGVAWRRILPAYARVLSVTAPPGEAASLLDGLVRDFDEREREWLVDACLGVVPGTHRAAIGKLR